MVFRQVRGLCRFVPRRILLSMTDTMHDPTNKQINLYIHTAIVSGILVYEVMQDFCYQQSLGDLDAPATCDTARKANP